MLEGSSKCFRRGVGFSTTKSSSSHGKWQLWNCTGARMAVHRLSCYLPSAHLQPAMWAGKRNPSSRSLLHYTTLQIIQHYWLSFLPVKGVVSASCQTLQLPKEKSIQAKELRLFQGFPPELQETAVNDQNSPCLFRSFVYLLTFKSVHMYSCYSNLQ